MVAWVKDLKRAFEECGTAFVDMAFDFVGNAGHEVDGIYHFRDPDLRASAERREALRKCIASLPWVAAADVRRGTLGLRFEDSFVAELEEVVASAGDAPTWFERPALDQRCAVEFLDPNLNKPLHVGHLRNLVIGQALASLCTRAGADVVRLVIHADIGRSVCETLAGLYEREPNSRVLPEGTKADHFVGELYARYAQGAVRADQPAELPATGREDESLHGAADDVLARWSRGDVELRADWNRVRRWALAGQRSTLHALGVRFEREYFQSDAVESAKKLAREALAQGYLTPGAGGAIVYRTDRSEFERLVIVRSDGFPTEFGRNVAVIRRLQADLAGVDRYFAVFGDEWSLLTELMRELLCALGPCPVYQRTAFVPHAMVLANGSKMKSRDGQAVLIDDVLGALLESTQVRDLAGKTDGRVSSAEVADIVLKAFFLSRETNKAVHFSIELLLDERRNPGWALARAWCLLSNGRREGGVPALPERRRRVVLSSQGFASHLGSALEAAKPKVLLGYAADVAAQSLERESDAELDRVSAVVLKTALQSLGMRAGSTLLPTELDPSISEPP